MTDDDDQQSPRSEPVKQSPTTKVGYKLPPPEHQFKKGQCPNPRGRPVKLERSLTLLQARRDLLAAMETPIKGTVDGRAVTLVAHEAIIRRIVKKALDGHGPSQRFLFKEYRQALAEHEADHDFGFLNMIEKEDMKARPKPGVPRADRFVNRLRRETRRY